MKTSNIIISVLLIAGIVFAVYVLLSSNSSLPAYAARHPLIKEAYTFAAETPEGLNGVNCYCGCMQHSHSGRVHSRGLLDCFMKNDGSFEQHASECDMCLRDALEVKEMTSEGLPKSEIKEAIDDKYR